MRVQMMLRTWNDNIFLDIRHRLQSAAIHLLEAERNGEAFDSQLVIGVRESYGMVPPVESCAQWVKRELCVSVTCILLIRMCADMRCVFQL